MKIKIFKISSFTAYRYNGFGIGEAVYSKSAQLKWDE